MRRWGVAAATVVAVLAAGVSGGPASAVVVPPAPTGSGGTLRGVMVSAATGEPLAGETVMVVTTLVADNGDPVYADDQAVTTAADGSYSVHLTYATGYYMNVGNWGENPSSSIVFGAAEPQIADDGTTYCWVSGADLEDPVNSTEITCYPPTVDVERFWSPRFNNAHFFTTNRAEAEHIKTSDTNWAYEGRAFEAFGLSRGECTEGSPVFRFYSPTYQSHFYTIDAAEKSAIIAGDRNWTYEGIAYCADTVGGAPLVPVYRFWSPKFAKHFYTVNQPEADHIIAVDRNWTYEGIAFYVLD